MRAAFVIASAFAATQAFAQAGFPPPPPKVSPVAGVIDMHVHSHPDVRPEPGRHRRRPACQSGHARHPPQEPRRGDRKPRGSRDEGRARDRSLGGIVLNKAVGGVNPDAVEWMHRTYGGRGKVVWLPTFESDKHVKTLAKPDARGLVVAPGGQVTPEMEAILKIIARENLVLATGHVHPEEIIAVVRRGRDLA